MCLVGREIKIWRDKNLASAISYHKRWQQEPGTELGSPQGGRDLPPAGIFIIRKLQLRMNLDLNLQVLR